MDGRDGVHRNGYPQGVHVGELHGDVQVLDPDRGILERNSNDLTDAERLGVHPNVAQEQAPFLALGNDVEHVLWNHTKVLLAEEGEVIIGSGDVAAVTVLS